MKCLQFSRYNIMCFFACHHLLSAHNVHKYLKEIFHPSLSKTTNVLTSVYTKSTILQRINKTIFIYSRLASASLFTAQSTLTDICKTAINFYKSIILERPPFYQRLNSILKLLTSNSAMHFMQII